MPDQYPDIAVIILAGGASSRMGTPKQLLGYNGTTMLGHSIALAKIISPIVVVVTGAASEQVTEAIDRQEIQVVHNPGWQTGMASSLKTGIKALDNLTEVDGAMILLCDQPLITVEHLQKLQQAFAAHQCNNITATTYDHVQGVPAIFPKSAFPQLLQLSGDEGARKLLRAGRHDMTSIPFEGASLDIDTPEDYHNII